MNERELVSTAISMSSCIGVGGKPPYSWANYFSLQNGGKVLNFWAENLEAADEQFNLGGKVYIRKFERETKDYGNKRYCIIDDDRIPQEWYYNKLCFTGGPMPSAEHAKEIYDYLGDPTNEFEQFTDPVSYYEKRGSTYNPLTGIIMTPIRTSLVNGGKDVIIE